jgi:hypothetical protein
VELESQYRISVRDRLFVIVAVGENANEFAKVAKNSDAKLDSVDSDLLYSTIVERLDSRVFAGSSNAPSILDASSRILEDIALDIGVKSYNMINMQQKYLARISNKPQARELVKKAIIEQVGEEMNGHFILDTAARFAYSEGFDGKLFPILITANDTKTLDEVNKAMSLLNTKTTVISLTNEEIKNSIKVKEVSEESVIEALKKVKQKASKSR